MFKVAIVEDEDLYVKELKHYFTRFEEESGSKFRITAYHDGDDLLKTYQGQFDHKAGRRSDHYFHYEYGAVCGKGL